MVKNPLPYFVILLLGLTQLSCSEKENIDPDSSGSNYFPLETGLYSVFKVKETTYNSFTDSTVVSYWLKVSVLDSFQNLENGISYRILRQTKENASDAWKTDSIWTARKYDQFAVSVENNVPIVNITFPVTENKTWDGNKLNNNEADEFEMVNVNQPFSNMFGEYVKTVTVIREDLPDVIVKNVKQQEIYAAGIGLVFKENSILNYKQGDFLGQEVVESGLKYFQYLTEYGEE